MIRIFKSILNHLPASRTYQERNFNELQAKVQIVDEHMQKINDKINELDNLINVNRELALAEYKNHSELFFSRTRSDIKYLKDMSLNCQRQPGIQYFILNIVDHCNLNCKGCNHFSCISKERFVDAETVISDLKQMSIVHGNIPRIGVMGGEPLLHPDLLKILYNTRKYFDNAEILLSTNGILLVSMKQDFWDICKDNNITIRITKYPISIDYSYIEECAKKNEVKIEFFLSGKKRENMKSVSFDITGRQNPNASFGGCLYANNCVFLDSGKLYTCEVAATSRIFADKFGVTMTLEKNDYIDIYNSTKAETLEYLSRPIPFCRFCNVEKRKHNNYVWDTTSKSISEWL